ncbi:MAG: ArsR family transcriptional regulator [Saprospiraceae bacterium]|nr:ArsR family transcriptional regulator [Saprospiraceae bacterium]
MIEALISSKTRIKLLLKFFLNSNTISYLRGLEQEFGESSNAIRIELNRFEQAGLLTSFTEGNKKWFRANNNHPLFHEIHNILLKHLGLDQLIHSITDRLGNIQKVYLTGTFSRGLDGPIIDLILIGDINKSFLIQLIERVEKLIHRKVRYVIFQSEETLLPNWEAFTPEPLLLWSHE